MDAISDICRICLKDDETVVNNMTDWMEIIEVIAQIKISLNDEYPEKICDECVQQLISANEIRNLVIQSQNYFVKLESGALLDSGEVPEENLGDDVLEDIAENDESLFKYAILEEVLVGGQEEGFIKDDEIVPFRCCICDEGHKSLDELENHCTYTHNNRKLTIIAEDEMNDGYCLVCDRKFNSVESINRHRLCGDCGKSFATSESLLVHTQKKVCQEETRPKQVSAKSKLTKQFGCCKCPDLFISQEACQTHFNTTHAEEKYTGSERGPLICKFCTTPFTTKLDLQKHLKAPRIKTYVCDQCNEQLSSFPKFKQHIESMHGATQEFGCDECEKVYDRLDSLRYHKYMHHNEKNNRLCPDCGKVFKKKISFVEHRNIHLGLRPHVCELCKNGFTSTGALRTHMRSHTGAKPFKCKFCPKRYSHYSDMKRHSYSHTGDYPYVCETCNKGFAKRGALNSHKATHENR